MATHLFLLLSFLGALVLAATDPCVTADTPDDASVIASSSGRADDRVPTPD